MSSTAASEPEDVVRSLFPQLPRSAWMSASLLLLCGVGVASAVMVSASSSAYNTAVAANSPTVFYHLDEGGAGTAADSSGNGNNGTYGGATITYSVTGAMTGDNAVTTAGGGDVVTASDASLPNSNSDRSVEVWEKTTSTSSQDLVNYGTHGGNQAYFVILTGGSTVWVSQWGSSLYFTSPYSLADGGWHQIAVTYDSAAGTHTAYVDGQSIGVQTFGAALNTTATGAGGLNIGSGAVGSFVGSLDEVSVYGSALAATDVSAHWQAAVDAGSCPANPSTGYAGAVHGDSPVRYWRLGDSGSAALDFSGNCKPAAYAAGTSHVSGAISGDGNTAVAPPASHTTSVAASATGLPLGASARSVEFWEKTSDTGTQTMLNYGLNAGNEAYYVEISNTSIVLSQWGGSLSFASPYSLADGNWHHIVATYDGSDTHAVYADGQQLGQQGFGAALNTTADTGGALQIGSTFNGDLDEVAIYSTALDSTHVRTHWRDGLGASCASVPSMGYAGTVIGDGPTRFWRLAEGSGTRAADSTSNCGDAAYNPGATHTGTGALVSDPAGGVTGSTTSVLASADQLPSGNSARSVDLWEKSRIATGSTMTLLNYGPNSGNNAFYLQVSGSSVVFSNWGGSLTFTAGASLADANWHHIVLTKDATRNFTVWADGTQLGAPQNFGSDIDTKLTSSLAVGGSFDGEIDDVAIYDASHLMDQTKVTAHFEAGATVGGPVTTSQYKSSGSNELVCRCAHGDTGKYPIDNATGNFYHQFTDISIPGRGTPLAFSRNYNSADAATDGPLGYGWTTNYGTTSLGVSGTTATLTDENGSQATFTQSGGVWSPSAPRFIATLVENGGGTSWTLKRFNQDTLTFNSTGQLTADADLNGYTTSYAYTSGKLTTVTDEAGRTLTLAYTGSHITSVTDANVSPSRVASYTYDGSGNLTDVTDVLGGDQHFTYDVSHQMTVMKDPKCEALGGGCPGIQNTYTSGQITAQKDQLNRETDFDYTAVPGATKVTDPKGNITVTYYNQGLRVAETHGYGTAAAATTHFTYDPTTLALATIVNANGNTTTDTVDSSGNVLTRTDALGQVTTNTYNAFNEVLTTEDPNGVTTTNTYDGDGDLTRTCRPLPGGSCGATPSSAQVTTYNHADSSHPGDVTSVVDPDSKTTTMTYDTYGDVASSTDPLSNEATSTYNADGFLLTSVSPKGNVGGCSCASTYTTTNTYNKFGEVLTSTDPLSHVTTMTYDADGNKATVEDPNSHTTTFTYDVANQLTTTTRPDTTTAVTDYNDDGTVLDQKDGKGTAILTYAYDALARVTTVTDALSNATTFTYDAAGNRLTQQDPGGNCATPSKCTTTTYDVANQPTAVTYSDGVTPNITSITYDSDGQRTGMTDGTGTSAWVFDHLHRVTSYTNGNGTAVSYAYNLRNLPTTITYPGSHAVTNTYDNAGRMLTVQDWLGTPNTTTFGYDENSNLTSDTFQSGIVDTYSFNAANQQTAVSDVNGGTTIFAATYTRDSNGQLASDSSQAANQGSFKYTSLNQLCYAGSSSSTACSSAPANSYPYGFDAADNLTTIENAGHSGTNAQQFNTADELCWTVSGASANSCGSAPAGATAFSYDDRGNRTSQVPNAGSATCTAFDQAARLTSVKTGTGSSCTSPTTVGTYAYDGSGMRQSKTVSGTTTQFLSSGSGSTQALLDEKAGSANPTYYLYGPGGRVIEQVDPSGGAHFYHCDQIGSVRAVTNSGGTTDATYTYDPYGNVVTSTNPGSITNNLQFQGQYADAESGLYYLRARYYDPTTAQFMSLDPAVDSTMSPYAYVSGNPLNGGDPTGLDDGCGWNPVCSVAGAWNQMCGVTGWCGGGLPTGKQGFSPADTAVREGGPPISAIYAGAFLAIDADAGAFMEAGVVRSAVRCDQIALDAGRGSGMFGLGSASSREAAQAGANWVGNGYRVASDGKTMISSNGLRQYRPPSWKPDLGQTQANFESRSQASGKWTNNGHLDINP